MDIPDYDSGLLNDYGGGNVDWWWDYIRAEINRCNEYWRSQLEDIKREPEDSADEIPDCAMGDKCEFKNGVCMKCRGAEHG